MRPPLLVYGRASAFPVGSWRDEAHSVERADSPMCPVTRKRTEDNQPSPGHLGNFCARQRVCTSARKQQTTVVHRENARSGQSDAEPREVSLRTNMQRRATD